jgi:hypothetical protein
VARILFSSIKRFASSTLSNVKSHEYRLSSKLILSGVVIVFGERDRSPSQRRFVLITPEPAEVRYLDFRGRTEMWAIDQTRFFTGFLDCPHTAPKIVCENSDHSHFSLKSVAASVEVNMRRQ